MSILSLKRFGVWVKYKEKGILSNPACIPELELEIGKLILDDKLQYWVFDGIE